MLFNQYFQKKSNYSKQWLSWLRTTSIYTTTIRKNKIHFLVKQDESFVCFDFGLSLSLFWALRLMTRNVFLTLKSIEDADIDIVGVAAVDLFVKIHWVDSSCLFSDTTLEWILDMAVVYVAVVEGLDSSGFPGLFFGILNFLTLFWLLDVPFAAIAFGK